MSMMDCNFILSCVGFLYILEGAKYCQDCLRIQNIRSVCEREYLIKQDKYLNSSLKNLLSPDFKG